MLVCSLIEVSKESFIISDHLGKGLGESDNPDMFWTRITVLLLLSTNRLPMYCHSLWPEQRPRRSRVIYPQRPVVIFWRIEHLVQFMSIMLPLDSIQPLSFRTTPTTHGYPLSSYAREIISRFSGWTQAISLHWQIFRRYWSIEVHRIGSASWFLNGIKARFDRVR